MKGKAAFERVSRKVNRTDQREVDKRVDIGTRDTALPIGNGKAGTDVTRGLKTWFSTREAGMTVESTVRVRLTCGQSEEEIREAAEEAGRIAEHLALEGSEEMGLHLEPLMGKSQAQPEPPPARRSEHPKHRRGRR